MPRITKKQHKRRNPEPPEFFSVYQFFQNGTWERVKHRVSDKEAIETAHDLINRPAAKLGIISEVLVTDSGDIGVFEWKHGEGIVWPKIEHLKTRKNPLTTAEKLDRNSGKIVELLTFMSGKPFKYKGLLKKDGKVWVILTRGSNDIKSVFDQTRKLDTWVMLEKNLKDIEVKELYPYPLIIWKKLPIKHKNTGYTL